MECLSEKLARPVVDLPNAPATVVATIALRGGGIIDRIENPEKEVGTVSALRNMAHRMSSAEAPSRADTFKESPRFPIRR